VSEDRPLTDDRDPADVVAAMVDHVLDLAKTWPAWDGEPRPIDDRVYTPHKAVRRVTDHLIDHLAQVEARLAGTAGLEDHWHGSAITTPADMAPFTQEDLDEAASRLTRLRELWRLRLRGLEPYALDETVDGEWSIREIAFHVIESAYYADAIGKVEPRVET
jgi:hypothetical protein